MTKTRGFQFSQLTLQHIDFVASLESSGVFTTKDALEEITEYLSNDGLPKEAKPVILPFDEEVYRLVHQHLQSGRRKIAIYKDGEGQRYVAADYLVV